MVFGPNSISYIDTSLAGEYRHTKYWLEWFCECPLPVILGPELVSNVDTVLGGEYRHTKNWIKWYLEETSIGLSS